MNEVDSQDVLAQKRRKYLYQHVPSGIDNLSIIKENTLSGKEQNAL